MTVTGLAGSSPALGTVKKILIVTSEYGSGHKTPAEALRAEFVRQGHSAEIFDFKDIIGTFTERITKELFNFATTHVPLLHRGLAAATDSNTVLDAIVAIAPAKVSANLDAYISQMRPDTIVTTFPAANRVIAELKSKHTFQLVSVVTDLETLHAYWYAPGTDAHIAPLPETVAALEELGASPETIFQLGYPLRAAFFESKDADALRKKLSIPANTYTALYMAHTAPDPFVEDLAWLLEKTGGITPIIVCGKNDALKEKLARELPRAHVLGFIDNMDEYFRVADVAIGKAGTGFVMEAAAMGCPVVITKYLKPQEEGNVDIFTKRGFGFVEKTAVRAMKRILALRDEPAKVKLERSRAMRALFPRNTTQAIVQFVADLK